MKVPVKNISDIGQVIRITRISQDLDQLTAAQLSNTGQSFQNIRGQVLSFACCEHTGSGLVFCLLE